MDIQAMLAEANAFHKGKHFVYTSGEHGDAYVNLRILKESQNKEKLAELSCELLNEVFEKAGIDMRKPVTVIGPDTLGRLIAEEGTLMFNNRRGTKINHLRLVATTHQDDTKTFGWGMRDPVPPEKVQVIYVDDLMNAGSTLEKVRPIIDGYGKIVAVATIADRSGFTAADLRVPHFTSLVQFKLERFKPEDCSHCKKSVPIVRNLGHGHKFEVAHPDYVGGFIDL